MSASKLQGSCRQLHKFQLSQWKIYSATSLIKNSMSWGYLFQQTFQELSSPLIKGHAALGLRAGKVTIVDSHSTSMAMGFQILAAVRIADAGASLTDCIELIERARAHVGVYFVVDTLKFLHRWGVSVVLSDSLDLRLT